MLFELIYDKIRNMRSLLQSNLWANFKKKYGWVVHEIEGVKIFERRLPFHRSFFYIPELTSSQHSLFGIRELLKKIWPLAKKRKAIFVRIEPLEHDQKIKNHFKNIGLKRAFEELQPWHRQWINLKHAEEEILQKMKPKGRYNIRLASRKGVKVVKSRDPKDIEILYKLYQATAKREGFSPRTKEYFVDLFHSLLVKDHGLLFIAYYEGGADAALLVTFYDKIASYLYGGSSRKHKNVMSPYLLHWEAIREAKKRGMHIYDMLAIAPRDDPKHKHYGLRRFKQQFGGREVHLVGGWDKVYSKFWYFLFKMVEKIRRR
jgi:lipid II:glycine glycyltransferase (peptidoglycan interpeptide bridge formation enzyme)